MALQLFNTSSGRLMRVRLSDPSRATFYSCGPTVYDDAHIGNFRAFLAADVLRRWLQSPLCVVSDLRGNPHVGPRSVHHVMNITDVGHMTDDAEGGEAGEDRMAVAGKRLLEAKKAGTLPAGVDIDPRDPHAIARFYESRFKEDAVALGLVVAREAGAGEAARARHMPRASEHVAGPGGMIEVIARLIERGNAYVVGDAGMRVVYFSVQSFPRYGQLSGNTLDALRAGEGGRVSAINQASKRHPADFLLWKEDASHVMRWQSPWGEGYPGWHIECSAMSASCLGAVEGQDHALIDLHSGGEDNIFPHHECEIAQSCCAFANGRGEFARHWFHARFLLVEGTKMSKSKGNFFTARDLFARGHSPAAVRLELIRTHYRSNANFTLQGLADCERMLERWRSVAQATSEGQGDTPAQHDLLREVGEALHDDLNVARAIAALNVFASRVGTRATSGDARAVMTVDDVLGVLSLQAPKAVSTALGVWADGLTPEADVEALLVERRDARARKDFARSDVIRDELARRGLAIKDMAGGRVEVRKA